MFLSYTTTRPKTKSTNSYVRRLGNAKKNADRMIPSSYGSEAHTSQRNPILDPFKVKVINGETYIDL